MPEVHEVQTLAQYFAEPLQRLGHEMVAFGCNLGADGVGWVGRIWAALDRRLGSGWASW